VPRRSPVLYSLFEKVEGDISLHNNKKYINPKYVRVGARSFGRDEAFSYYHLALMKDQRLFIRPIKGIK
jgi:hypothetical protein